VETGWNTVEEVDSSVESSVISACRADRGERYTTHFQVEKALQTVVLHLRWACECGVDNVYKACGGNLRDFLHVSCLLRMTKQLVRGR
jgi:hypothetical protein